MAVREEQDQLCRAAVREGRDQLCQAVREGRDQLCRAAVREEQGQRWRAAVELPAILAVPADRGSGCRVVAGLLVLLAPRAGLGTKGIRSDHPVVPGP